VVKLEENYRSTASILNLANAVIAGNTARREKVLRSTAGPGEPVRCLTVPDEHAEVDAIVGRIVKLLEEAKSPANSIAILMRAAIQARPFEEKLRLRKIPYTLVGGQSYFDRKEVRDVLAYWKVCVNPRDDLSLLRILNTPRRGFGDVSIQKIDAIARAESIGLLEAIGRVAGGLGDFTPSLRQACVAIRDLFARARERLERKALDEMARQVLEEGGYREAVNALYTDPLTRQARWNAVEDLLKSVERWRGENLSAPFEEFLESVALDAEEKEDEETRLRGIALMTLHSAKGLEFPHVFLVGVEEDLLPHKRSQADGDHAIEEERRLLYVGVTRARVTLTLTHASTRTLYGEPRMRLPSRFLAEVAPQGLYEVEKYDPGVQASETDVEDFLGQYRRIRGK
jgi:DNA helicase-2/ATP-dependent DNA helicase PcrA